MLGQSKSIVNREPAGKPLLTARQAAQLLGISPRLLWGLTQSGEIASVRIGTGRKRPIVRYSRDSLNQFIATKTHGGGPTPGTDHTESPLLTAPEAARLLSVSVRTLWKLTDSGEVGAVRIGFGQSKPRVLYSLASLRHYVARWGRLIVTAQDTDTKEGNERCRP